jgi:hypothetical protein
MLFVPSLPGAMGEGCRSLLWIPVEMSSVPAKPKLLKIGRRGVLFRGKRIPASFFRHRQPGKRFVVLDRGVRMLMHVRASDSDAIREAYLSYLAEMRTARKNIAN